MNIVRANAEMAAEMAQIERESFGGAHAWSENSIRQTLENAAAIAFCTFAEDGAMTACVLGTALYGEGELLHIATRPQYRGIGCGYALLTALLSAMRAAGTETVYLEVRESNAPAIGLYKKCGFTACGKRKRYYKEPVEDAVLMMCRLSEDAAHTIEKKF